MSKSIYWPYIIFAYLSLFALGLLDNVRGPLFPQLIDEFRVGDTKASLFFAVASLFSFLGSYLSSSLVVKMGSLHLLRLGLAMMSLSYLGFYIAPNFISVLLFSCNFGLGFGFVTVTQHLVIQEGADNSHRRQLFSGLHSMYAGASLCAPLLMGLLYSLSVDWRVSFALAAIVPLSVFMGSYFIKENTQTFNTKIKIENEIESNNNQQSSLAFIVAGLIISFYVTGEILVATRMVLYVQRHFNISLDQAPKYLATFFCLLLLGRLLFTGVNFSKIKSETIITVCLISSIICSLVGWYYSPWIWAMTGFFMAPVFAVCMDFIMEQFKSQSTKALAFAMSMASLVTMSLHFFVGWLTEQVGIQMALLAVPILHILSLVCLKLTPKVLSYQK